MKAQTYFRIWELAERTSRRIKISPLEEYTWRFAIRAAAKRALVAICQWAIAKRATKVDQFANVPNA